MNGYFDRERQLADDPYLETREKEDQFLRRVLQAAPTQAQDNPAVEEDLDAAMDFINEL